MNRIKAIWQNGCFEKMDDHAVYTIPNHHSSKTDVLPKTFVQITLATKWLVKHSNTSPNQQRWPLPSLLSLSYFYASGLLLGGHDWFDWLCILRKSNLVHPIPSRLCKTYLCWQDTMTLSLVPAGVPLSTTHCKVGGLIGEQVQLNKNKMVSKMLNQIRFPGF